jgi:homogentisate 1,2-dioxygenase
MSELKYNSGFGNEFATEALEGALPIGRNSPQKVKYGLYAEQVTGSAFTAPRAQNKRSWLYRIKPSVMHTPFEPYFYDHLRSAPFNEVEKMTPNQLRWDPLQISRKDTDFVDGLITMAGNGNIDAWTGLAVHVYVANISMNKKYFYNADGEMLFVPQMGRIVARTELGILDVKPGEILVIPRGIKFAIDLPEGPSRGYICENYGMPFTLPDLGPIGANGLANPRDFQYPVAAFEDNDEFCNVIAKFAGNLWMSEYDHSPFNVVAWHGNYAPYKYDLDKFNTINTVSFDHPDPSIFTVLTSPSHPHGTANIDFVIFPPRWMVATDTFRPPYFHRNIMSEFMGLIKGVYDAKEAGGFQPGGCSLHNCMSGHGPDGASFLKASENNLEPVYLDDTLAFMFESRYMLRATKFAMETLALQKNYHHCWKDMPKLFNRHDQRAAE